MNIYFSGGSNKGKWSQQSDQGFLIKKGVLIVYIMIFVISTVDSTRLSSFQVLKRKFFFS
jgi:hypothetical protein